MGFFRLGDIVVQSGRARVLPGRFS